MSLPRTIDYVTIFLNSLKGSLGSKVDTNEGSRWDALGGGLGQMFVRANKLQIEHFDAHTRERAKGQDLDDYCRNHGPIRRFGAKKSWGSATFARATATFGATSVPVGHQVRIPFEGRSVIVKVTAARPLGVGELSVTAPVEAITEGPDANVGNVTAGLANVSPLEDTTVLPTAVFVSGGSAEENDDELLVRQRLYEEGRQRATDAAIALGALMVNGVKHVVVAKYEDTTGRRGGQGAIYVGDRDWVSTPEMLSAVAASIEKYRGMQAVTVLGMTNSDVTITATITMMRPVTSYDLEAIRTAAVARVLEYFNNRKATHEYSTTSIAGRIERAHDEILTVALSAPVSSVANPLAPSALALAGFPATLTRYHTKASLINLTIKGPA